MSRRIILSPDAKADIRSSVDWYKRQALNQSFRFIAETRAALHRISQHPYRFPLVNAIVRRALMKLFPYAIYFTVDEGSVFVIPVIHQRRADTLWMERNSGQN